MSILLVTVILVQTFSSGFGIRCYTGQKYAEFPGLQQTPIKSVECGANENACFTANVTMVLPKTSFIESAIYGICINDTVDPCESYCDKIRQLSPLTSCTGTCCHSDDCNKNKLAPGPSPVKTPVNSTSNGRGIKCRTGRKIISPIGTFSLVKTEECSPSAKACLTGEFLVTNGAETVSCFEGYCTNKVKRCDDYCNKMKSLIPQATGCKSDCCFEDDCNRSKLLDSSGVMFYASILTAALTTSIAILHQL